MATFAPEHWRALEQLLDQALDLAPVARQRLLDQLSTQSPVLARDLSQLLREEADANREGFLDDSPEVSLAGVVLGDWRLERPLGHGGMGTVWLAARADGRFEGRAAVKLLNLALLSEAGQLRFRREGSMLARLAHPGIARLLDAGVSGAGQPYLVLEYVDGVPIDAYVREQGLDREATLRLLLQVLHAVAHAHASLIVHRDLKPSNILVTAEGTAKLLDFGIAKLKDGEQGAERTEVTVEGGRLFTPLYAAPEQLEGGALTTATDVYSLGVLLYLLLSGRHPTMMEGATPMEGARALLEAEPAPLGAGDLDTILAKALRKDAAQRYQTVSDFTADLEHYLRGEPVSARPPSAGYRLARFVGRHRVGVALGLAVAAGLVGLTLYSLAQSREARRQRDAAIRATERAEAQLEFQNLLLSEVGDRPITMRQALDTGRVMLERQFAGDSALLTTMLVQLASRYAELGDNGVRGALLAHAESLTVATGAMDQLAGVRCDIADNLRESGQYTGAWAMLARAESLVGPSTAPEVRIRCLHDRADLEDETHRPKEAVQDLQRALAIKDGLGERRDLAYIKLLSSLGGALSDADQPRLGVEVFQRAIAAMDSSGRGGMYMRSVLRHNLAVTLAALGETASAELVFHDAMERIQRGERPGRIVWQTAIHYAETALTQGHADSALKYFTLIVAQGVSDSNDYWQGRGLFGAARAEIRLGRLAAAHRSRTRLAAILARRPSFGRTDDQIPSVETLDGWIALAEGDTGRAAIAFRAPLTTHGYFEGMERLRLRPVVLGLAECDLALGRVDEALRLAREAYAIAAIDTLADRRSALVGEARLVEGRALLAAGDTTAARIRAGQAVAAMRFGGGPDFPGLHEAEALATRLGS